MPSVAITKGPLWMQNVDYPAGWDRTLYDLLYPAEGVIKGFGISPSGGLQVSITAGSAVIEGDEVANQGKYLVQSDGMLNLTLDPVGVARTDYICLLINDSAVSGGRPGDNATIEALTSVPADSAILLYTINLPAGATTVTGGMITDNRSYVTVIPDNSITSSKIISNAVTAAKIAAGAVTSAALAAGSVVSAAIANGAVVTAAIADLAVTTAKLANNAVTNAKLANNAVDTANIVNSAITAPKVANRSIPASKLELNTITASEIGPNAVNTSELVDGAVTTNKINNSAVTNDKIAQSIGSLTNSSTAVVYAKIGNIVTISGRVMAGSPVTLPAGFRPNISIQFSGTENGGGGVGTVSVTTGGVVSFVDSTASNMVYFSTAFPATP